MLDLNEPLVSPLPPAEPTSNAPEFELLFQQKERLLAGYLAAFAVVYYRHQAERAPAQLQATLHIENESLAFPAATVTLGLHDGLTLAEAEAEAAAQLALALAGVAEELGAGIVRGRISFPAPEARSPDQTWCVTLAFGPPEAVAISFSCTEAADGLRVEPYLPAHVQSVFGQLATGPGATVGHVFFLAPEEVAQLRQFAASPQRVGKGGAQQLHHLFEDTARTYPNHPAVLWEGRAVPYHELNALADALAGRLQAAGVQAGDFVGLLMHKSVELYAGMLAVLKAGAAYVPLDLSYPADRVTFILNDCGARALLVNDAPPAYLAAWPGQVLNLAAAPAGAPAPLGPVAIGPESIAYIIYTSGTTGLPKGVLIPHRSICHLVRAEQVLFQATPQDRVVQGFSVAFDASLEELWLAWAAGAALVPVPEDTMKAPDALPAFLSDNQVTVFSTVPTLLSLLAAAVPSLRLLILGGEVCPPELLAKWATRQCRVVNTYGPTEATVVATAADFVPGQKLTIGRPIAGYEALLLDQLGQLVPLGGAGELCIGGPALAAGYLNRPELTAAKFNTVAGLATGFSGRLYRTGDLARFEPDGNIDFLGRIDTQVKIRGFRVELAEIESLLLQWPGVRNAAVALKESGDGVQSLIAYLILDPDHPLLDTKAVRAYLRERLAPYMLPAALVPLATFPLLTSGKVDRKALPYPVPTSGDASPSRELALPRTPTEAAIYAAWQKRFDTADLSVTDDFFEMGGNSLLASLIISELRQQPQFVGLSVKEMYTRRTVEALAQAVDAAAAGAGPAAAAAPLAPPRLASHAVRVGTAALQAASVFLFYLVPVLTLNGSILVRPWLERQPDAAIVALVAAAVLAYVPLACGLVIILKWLVIGKFRAGEYPLWGFYYFRFWLVKKLVEAAPLQLLSATPYLNVFYRLLGARIGHGVYIGSTRLMTFDLLTLADGASIAREAGLLGYRVERDRLILGPIRVGRDAYVGLRAILETDTALGDESELDDLSVVAAGQRIAAREAWQGSPAQRVRGLDGQPAAPVRAGAGYMAIQTLAIALTLLLPTAASLPVFRFFYDAVERWGLVPAFLTLVPLSAGYVLVLGALLAGTKRFVAGRQRAGTLPLYSPAYVRHWLADAVLAQSLSVLKPLYATIYAPLWLRLLGARVGRRAEISTLNHISADHLTVEAGAFLADSVSVGAPRVQRGVVAVAATVVGARTFIGNSAVLAGGTVLGPGQLVGALSTAPPAGAPANTSWVGSPAFLLPNRPVSQSFDAGLTFDPPTRLVWARGAMEFFKITLPFAFVSATFAVVYHYCSWHLRNGYPFWISALLGTAVLFGTILGFSLLTAALKWALIGRYRPAEKPLWSSYVWRDELINSLCESYVFLYWVAPLLGTPFATSFFQLMGSRIGHSVYLDTTEITEFDLAWVADHAVLNNGCTIQTHLFEDRVMKMSTLRIGRYATVGTSSVVLYDSVIGPGAVLKSLSLLMKGETLPANTRWQGIPCAFIPGG
ncbi:Pls/PosA family non-ribosomal peptide synthetase [Hymenobacter caeli]|uniref:Non-ribosomal peptide synthetase-like protein n=1 Tax=Hymenobacter caeli TaxID=2735894 RepID=A0ABX2FTF9_9BACT|nr:Pls/PosA family non-ribosomal peptide synthetase [Hymenobacter caeli]NRT20487.1 non-ribosomal peptide synthetase-like protein [Hymenobacter caeli]